MTNICFNCGKTTAKEDQSTATVTSDFGDYKVEHVVCKSCYPEVKAFIDKKENEGTNS